MMPRSEDATSAERRSTLRLALHLTIQVWLPRHPTIDRGFAHWNGETIDACTDGRGLALWLPNHSHISLGIPIRVLSAGATDDIHGIVVSRLGLKAHFRVGVRVDQEHRERVRDLIASQYPPPNT